MDIQAEPRELRYVAGKHRDKQKKSMETLNPNNLRLK